MVEPVLADAVAEVYYWLLRYLAWGLWGLLFGGIGMLAARFVWKNRRLRADELEKENKRLRRELEELGKRLGTRM